MLIDWLILRICIEKLIKVQIILQEFSIKYNIFNYNVIRKPLWTR